MITDMDAARVWAFASEAHMTTRRLIEQLEAVTADDDVTNPSYALATGVRLKAEAALKELDHSMEFADELRKVTRR